MIVYSGSQVMETFASTFKTLVNGLAIDNETVNFHLNQQDATTINTINLSCDHAFAYEHITFMNALDSEIREHGIAIVMANDYRGGKYDKTIFVVCDDEL